MSFLISDQDLQTTWKLGYYQDHEDYETNIPIEILDDLHLFDLFNRKWHSVQFMNPLNRF